MSASNRKEIFNVIGGSPAPRHDLLAAFGSGYLSDPADMWNGVARVACGGGGEGGIVLERQLRGASGEGVELDPAAGAVLAARLAGGQRSAVLTDDSKDFCYAAAAIGDRGDASFIWMRRPAQPFLWRELVNLRTLATLAALLRALEQRSEQAELLLAETRHRSGNDLQLVSSLLGVQSRIATDPNVRDTLEAAAERVVALARARQTSCSDLSEALTAFCDAFAEQVFDRGIRIHLTIEGGAAALDERRAALVLIAVNELVTNAVKHAFRGDLAGNVHVSLGGGDGLVRVTIEDDGAPMPDVMADMRTGSGLHLITRLLESARGRLALPVGSSKVFVVDVPVR